MAHIPMCPADEEWHENGATQGTPRNLETDQEQIGTFECMRSPFWKGAAYSSGAFLSGLESSPA